jgi:hypothetical protein
VATQLEELRGELEWIEYLATHARGSVSDMLATLNGHPIEPAPFEEEAMGDAEFQMLIAFAASLRQIASSLVADTTDLQARALAKWHSLTASPGYWERINGRFRGQVLMHEHIQRVRAEAKR